MACFTASLTNPNKQNHFARRKPGLDCHWGTLWQTIHLGKQFFFYRVTIRTSRLPIPPFRNGKATGPASESLAAGAVPA
jgi:hypothetical protein